MKKKIALVAFIGFGFALACMNQTKHPTVPSNYYCSTGAADSLCADIPKYINEIFGNGYSTANMHFNNPTTTDSSLQTPLDLFSWQTFIALNWPAGGGSTLTSAGARVWEQYKDPAEVFGSSQATLMLHLTASKQQSLKFFYMFSKSPHGLLTHPAGIDDFQESDDYPLVDKYGNFTLYEVRMNDVEADFDTKNGLTTKAGIIKYWYGAGKDTLILPTGDSTTAGAIEVKAAWRILTAKDDSTRFFCRYADVFMDSLHTADHKPFVIHNVKVGLVGMHIIRTIKGTAGQNLIWSTFEQEDNAPDSGHTTAEHDWSYFDHCPECPINTPFKLKDGQKQYIWDTMQPYAKAYLKDGHGNQVDRQIGIFQYTDSVNAKWRTMLGSSVWSHYKLVGTQWGVAPEEPGASYFFPPALGNTTLETFQQTNNCISCHSQFATIKYKDTTVHTGMSFIYGVYAK